MSELRIDDCRGKLGTPGKVLAYRGLSVGMGDSEAEAIADLERAERRQRQPVVYDPRVGVPNGPGALRRLKCRPILRYPGGKSRLADWIISYMPPHTRYLELFFGGGAVFFSKAPVTHEVINDKNGDIANLFRVIRDHGDVLADKITLTPWSREEFQVSFDETGEPIEQARRFLVRINQSHASGALVNRSCGWRNSISCGGSLARLWSKLPDHILAAMERLKNAYIENDDAVALIIRHAKSDVLIYADPPYPLSTRSGALYQHEMTDEQHAELLDALNRHPGPVLLSGRHCKLYDDRLKHWSYVEHEIVSEKANRQTEVLWLNSVASQHGRQLTLFDEVA